MRALLIAAMAVLVCGCGTDDWSAPHPKPVAVGTLGPGFVDAPPAPEATITPRPGSWDGVHPSKGYRVVLLSTGEDAALETSVKEWAEQEDVSLKTVKATEHIAAIVEAMNLEPDLIVAVGNGLVEALDLVTASHLDQQFLVLGAELPEPTFNVTAADWPGAFTTERATRALRAGVAAVLHGLTGIVIRLD